MSDVILFGPAQSSYVRTARMICAEKGISHQLQPIDLRTPSHESLHPWLKVPILRHGDFKLFETSAIARYVNEAFDGPDLLPATAQARAVMEQWVSAINCYIYDSVIRNYSLQYVGAALRGQAPDRAAIDAGVPAMQRDLARLDGAYAGRTWIAGDRLSLVDLFVAPIVQTVGMFPEGRDALARAEHLTRAFDSLRQRPSYHAAHDGVFG